jgi:hypothetical protein
VALAVHTFQRYSEGHYIHTLVLVDKFASILSLITIKRKKFWNQGILIGQTDKTLLIWTKVDMLGYIFGSFCAILSDV